MKKVVPAAKAAPESTAELPCFMKLSQVMDLFGGLIPESTVRYWITSGRLSVYKPGKVLLFDRDEVLAFIRASKRTAINVGPA